MRLYNLCLLFFAALIQSGCVCVSHQWVSTDVPIELKQGEIKHIEFATDHDLFTLINLRVEKAIPFDELTCRLGVATFPDEKEMCKNTNITSVIDIEWVLTSDKQLIAKGLANASGPGGFGNTIIDRTLGEFMAEAGRKYELDIKVLNDATILRVTHPRLRVEVHPAAYLTPCLVTLPRL